MIVFAISLFCSGCIVQHPPVNSGNFVFRATDGSTVSGRWYGEQKSPLSDTTVFGKRSGVLVGEWNVKLSPAQLSMIRGKSGNISGFSEYYKLVADVEGGMFNGSWILFDKGANLFWVGNMKNGEPSGRWKWFNKSGNLIDSINYPTRNDVDTSVYTGETRPIQKAD